MRRFRKVRGLSQHDLADLTGISARMIGYYEVQASMPPVDKIEKITQALQVKASALIDPPQKESTVPVDVTQFDTRSLKKLQDILSLPPNDRAIIYRMLNKLLQKRAS